MLLIVALNGASGFVASFLLLHSGMFSMPMRYAIAMLVAYAIVLGPLRVWIRARRPERRFRF